MKSHNCCKAVVNHQFTNKQSFNTLSSTKMKLSCHGATPPLEQQLVLSFYYYFIKMKMKNRVPAFSGVVG